MSWRQRCCAAALALASLVPLSAGVSVYPAPSGTDPSPDFTATVNGVAAFVYFTSREGMQPVAPGNNVPPPSARNTSFLGFAFDGPNEGGAMVVVTVGARAAAPRAAALYPLRAAESLPSPAIAGRSVTLLVDAPRQLCLVLDGVTDAPLCLFADPPEPWLPSPGEPGVRVFSAGTTQAGVISVAPGETVYLAPGAHVYGRIELAGGASDGAACAAVRGRGVLDGHGFSIDSGGPPLISLPCSGALVEGVTLLNSPQYHLDGGYPRTLVQWVKAIAWGYSTDGFTGGAQSLFQRSFLKVNDDALKPFGTGTLARDIVLWQMENGCAVMGSWNLNADVGFITAQRLDVIRHERTYADYAPDALLCFVHGGSGRLAHYLFDDVRVDMPGWAAVQLWVANNSWAHPAGGVPGGLDMVVVRNFSSARAFLGPQAVQLQGYAPTSAVTNVLLDGVTFGGVPAAAADVAVTGGAGNVRNVSLCQDGCSRAIVGSDWTQQQKCSLPTSDCSGGAGGEGGGVSTGAVVAAVVGAALAAGAAAAALGTASGA